MSVTCVGDFNTKISMKDIIFQLMKFGRGMTGGAHRYGGKEISTRIPDQIANPQKFRLRIRI